MKTMKVLGALSAIVWMAAAASYAAEEAVQTPRIQIALLLDTSNSMDGLIEQAKTQLWKIVNEFVTVEKDGKRPELQIALFEYGNDGLEASDGYIRLVLPLTTDLDKVSEQLFALTTNGGSEYCGQVIKVAADTLEWSAAADDYKVIFIAGNEPFTQGDVDYRESCKAAITKGIIVNTIHCGSFDEGVQGKWQDGALLADGSYMSIDQNAEVVHIEAPQDTEIARLGTELNDTYIPYGALGVEKSANQAEQDVNATAAPGSSTQRAVTKASGNYRNADWDLVDALKEGTVKLEDVKDEDLPEAMQKMTAEERQAYVEAKAKARADLQAKVQELNDARNAYVAEEMRKRAESGEEQTLDAAMIKAIREQAQQRNFKLE
jgi:hypothetical protein